MKTLHRSPLELPTADDIVSHLLDLPKHIQARSKDGNSGPVAHTMLATHLARLLKYLHVDYPGFSLNDSEQESLKAVFQTLSKTGKMKRPISCLLLC